MKVLLGAVVLLVCGCSNTEFVGLQANGNRGVFFFDAIGPYDDAPLRLHVARSECFDGCGAFGDCAHYCSDDESVAWEDAVISLEPSAPSDVQVVSEHGSGVPSRLEMTFSELIHRFRIDVSVGDLSDTWSYERVEGEFASECADSEDNDGDGLVDCDDSSCSEHAHCSA